jgi:hypothetical protein
MTTTSIAVRKPYYRSPALAAVNNALTINVQDAAHLTFTVFSGSAATGITLVAEGQLSDTGPWVLLNMRQTDAASSISVTAALSGQNAHGWRVNTAGLLNVRMRVTAVTTGSIILEARLSDKLSVN